MRKRDSQTHEAPGGATKRYSAKERRTAAECGRLLFAGAFLSAPIKASIEANGGKPVDGFAHEMNGASRFAVIAVHDGRRWEAFKHPGKREARQGPRTIKITVVQGLYQAPLKIARHKGALRFVQAKRQVRVGFKETVTVFDHWCPVLSIPVAGDIELRNAIMPAIVRLTSDPQALPSRELPESDSPKPQAFVVRGEGGFRAQYVRAHQVRGLRKWLTGFVPTAIGKEPAPGFIVFSPAIYYALDGEADVKRTLESGFMRRLDGVRRIGADGEIRSAETGGAKVGG